MDMSNPGIIYEDENFLAVDKPAGLMVHQARVASGKGQAAREEKPPTLVDWLLERYPEIKTVGDDPAQRPGIVHRLDKDTSGVMLVAKNQKSFEYLKSLFQKHEIIKTYLAVVWGSPSQVSPGETWEGEPAGKWNVIDAPIGIQNGTTKRSIRSKKMAKEAVTEWRMITTWEVRQATRIRKKEETPLSHAACRMSLLEVKPKTGRTHQIRVHLASIGHPVVGDVLYGRGERRAASRKGIPLAANCSPLAPRLMLHALSVEFSTPDGRRMRIEAEPPEEFGGW
jgi:23S rRNA pseudouridine1911/1915/1917 synthase